MRPVILWTLCDFTAFKAYVMPYVLKAYGVPWQMLLPCIVHV